MKTDYNQNNYYTNVLLSLKIAENEIQKLGFNIVKDNDIIDLFLNVSKSKMIVFYKNNRVLKNNEKALRNRRNEINIVQYYYYSAYFEIENKKTGQIHTIRISDHEPNGVPNDYIFTIKSTNGDFFINSVHVNKILKNK